MRRSRSRTCSTTRPSAPASPGSGARAALDGLPGARAEHRPRGGRPPRGRARAATASRCAGSARDGERRDITYARARASSRTASPTSLAALGVGPGERVFALAGRIPELYVAALGTLKHGSGLLPAVLGLRPRADPPAPGARRRARAGHDAGALRGARSRRSAPRCPSLEHVLLVGDGAGADSPGTLDLRDAARRRRPHDFEIRADRPRGHGAAALHERHDRDAEGRGARARRRRRPPRHRRGSRSTCTPTTSSGAPPTRAG